MRAMKPPFLRSILPSLVALALLPVPANAFDPYLGIHQDTLDWVDTVLLQASGNPEFQKSVRDGQAYAEITKIGGPYDVRVVVKGKSGKDRRTTIMPLFNDGKGRIKITGRISRVGRKQRSSTAAVTSGDNLDLLTKARGSWEISDGVRTRLKFRGKTNGVPTRITGFMDLTAEGKYQLNLKLSYKRGNDLFGKPSILRFGL